MPLSECTPVCASLARALHIVESIAGSSYVVGGFIRDSLLGRDPRDIDIVVAGDPFAVAQRVARELSGSFVPLDQKHCIARVVLTFRSEDPGECVASRPDTLEIDFARCEGDIVADLARRDFTVNAIAMPIAAAAAMLSRRSRISGDLDDTLVDPLQGLRHLSDRQLRVCGNRAFSDDPGRLMRAVRLSHELGFTIDPATESEIRDHAHLVPQVAAERTREELLKILSLPGAEAGIRDLDRLGLLTQVFPELATCRDVSQPTCHFWDVLEHSIQTVATFEFVTGESDWIYGNDEMMASKPFDAASEAYLAGAISADASRATLAKLACLLHDVAKPQTKSLDDTGRARFLGHAQEGASTVTDILQRLRFSSPETSYVATLVRHHLRPSQMSAEGMPSRRAVYRFYRDASSAATGVLYLAMADYLACRGPLFTMSEWSNVCALIDFIMREHNRQEATLTPSKIIDGRELMRALGMVPGPTVGILLESIREAQAAGLVDSRDDALNLARKTIQSEHFTVRTSK